MARQVCRGNRGELDQPGLSIQKPPSAAVWRGRAFPAVSLALMAGVAWAYLVHAAGGTGGMGWSMDLAQPQAWTPAALLLLFAMWIIMMAGMMLPSAAPTILLFDAIVARRRAARRAYAPTAIFVLGYLLVWTGYSVLATLGQWALHRAALISPAMASTSGLFGGAVLVTAGAFQWTPLKTTCLRGCRSPLGWLTSEWREGNRGALVMGLRHGAYCVGCCWALMALLFVAGVMNLLWVAALAGLVLVEKIAPAGDLIGRVVGALMVAWGAWLLITFGA